MLGLGSEDLSPVRMLCCDLILDQTNWFAEQLSAYSYFESNPQLAFWFIIKTRRIHVKLTFLVFVDKKRERSKLQIAISTS